MLLCRGAAIDIEGDGEVGVDALVDFVILGTQLGGCRVLLDGFGLGGGSVLLVAHA